MIAEKSEAQVIGNLAGTSVKMSFDEDSLVHLMSVMTDLYSDPELAVIREYSTNALDAQIEGGHGGPIHVTLPSSFSPFFKVRDFGVGLSVEGLTEVYAKYGASTKRETNAQTGMLGLGCKSALTYTSQFTLVSVKDGVKSQVAVGRNEEGAGTVTVVSVEDTNEPSGTEVIVPCRAKNEFAEKARDFFSYWEKGTVLVDGKDPVRVAGLDVKGDGSLIVVEDPIGYGYGQKSRPRFIVVMGNVPYPVSAHPDLPINGSQSRLVARVPIGSVNFAPSREALMETDKTTATLRRVVDDLCASLATGIQRKIDAAKTGREAIKITSESLASLSSSAGKSLRLHWKDQPIPSEIPTSGAVGSIGRHSYKSRLDIARGGWNLSLFESLLLVTNYPIGENWTVGRRNKLDSLRSDLGVKEGQVLIFAGPVPPDIAHFAPSGDRLVVDWEQVKDIKLSQNTGGGPRKRIMGSYTIHKWDATHRFHTRAEVEADTLPDKLLYAPANRDKEVQMYDKIRWAAENGHTVVRLEANRKDKFLRDFPKAEPVQAEIDRLKATFQAGLSEQQKLALAVRMGAVSNLSSLASEVKSISDPSVVRQIKASSLKVDDLYRSYNTIRRAGAGFSLDVEDALDKYPLLTYGRGVGYHSQHAVLYINAAYAAANAPQGS